MRWRNLALLALALAGSVTLTVALAADPAPGSAAGSAAPGNATSGRASTGTATALPGALPGAAAYPVVAGAYTVDPVHSAIIFKIRHAGIGYVYGRFNKFSGQFSGDSGNPAGSSCSFNVEVESIDTANAQRDTHLRSPDFFDAKQFPAITFKSTKVAGEANGEMAVTGDLTLHGVTKAVTGKVKFLGAGEFPKGTPRAGVEGEITLKRSDFGMDKMMPGAGDEVRLMVAFEGIRK